MIIKISPKIRTINSMKIAIRLIFEDLFGLLFTSHTSTPALDRLASFNSISIPFVVPSYIIQGDTTLKCFRG